MRRGHEWTEECHSHTQVRSYPDTCRVALVDEERVQRPSPSREAPANLSSYFCLLFMIILTCKKYNIIIPTLINWKQSSSVSSSELKLGIELKKDPKMFP